MTTATRRHIYDHAYEHDHFRLTSDLLSVFYIYSAAKLINIVHVVLVTLYTRYSGQLSAC